MPPHQPSSLSTTDITLTGLGKTWGRLVGGNVLEIRRGDLVVRFDLAATAAMGHAVLCEAARGLPDERCKETA
jgi:hypothetical protein